jgi:hypothetical protein
MFKYFPSQHQHHTSSSRRASAHQPTKTSKSRERGLRAMILGRETRSALTSSAVDNDLAVTTIAMCGRASRGGKYFCHRCYANQGSLQLTYPSSPTVSGGRRHGTSSWSVRRRCLIETGREGPGKLGTVQNRRAAPMIIVSTKQLRGPKRQTAHRRLSQTLSARHIMCRHRLYDRGAAAGLSTRGPADGKG